ncbi:MAG: hypothetical protein HLX51_05095 [Micrococcaceae bacterium]|nr:hypothetical protein [Micrococcaceae bacterium]
MSLPLTSTKRHRGSTIVTGVCASVLVFTACQTDTTPEHSVTSEYLRFTEQPRENDIPDVALNEPALNNIADHYFRYLGVNGSTEFHMARTDHDDTVAQGLYFIAVDTETDDATSQCHGPNDLEPMVVQLDTPVEAFLIPDDTHVDELPEGWSQVRRNVVVITEPERAPEEAEVWLQGAGTREAHTLQRN